MFINMHRQLQLAKHSQMKIVFLDEAVFTFNTFNTKAWSSSYNSITVDESRLRVKTQAMISAISEDVGLEGYVIHPSSIAAKEFIEFLEMLSIKFNGREFAVFMDNL